MTLLDQALTRLLPVVPPPIVRRLATPYIAGPTLEDAVAAVKRLNAAGKIATVDVLGEEVTSAEEAGEIAAQYHAVLARIERERLDANISVKLSGLGLALDPDLCREHLEAVVDDAAVRGNFVRIDMEDSSTTTATLGLYRTLRASGRDNLGVVLQARLCRTYADIEGLENVRLCKGIYLERPALAYQEPSEIRARFLDDLDALLDRGSYVAVATHDEYLLSAALARIEQRGLARDAFEFQMLLGVRAARGDELVAASNRLRVYVPYGAHWYEYSVRRLKENPTIAGYVAVDVARRFAGAALALAGAAQRELRR